MTTTMDNSWMPSGRRPVVLGNTLKRALRLRQGLPVGSARVEREFYSFRYNFKPESVDTSKAGSVETKRAKDEAGPSSIAVVRPSQQNESGISFIGQENPAKEFECVLIFNEEEGTFTLEKLDSCITLHHDPKPTIAPRHVESPAPIAPSRISSASSSSHAQLAAVKQEEEESEGEIPETKPELKSKPPSRPIPASKPLQASQQPVSTSIPPPPHTPGSTTSAFAAVPPSHSAYSLPSRPTPTTNLKPKGKATVAAPPSQAPTHFIKSPNKRPVEPIEETLEIRRPQPPLKKARVVKAEQPQPPPPAPKPVDFAFPNKTSAVSLPPAPSPPAPEPSITADAMSDSEDGEWDDVTYLDPVAAPTAPSRAIVMEEIDEFPLPPRDNLDPPSMPMSTDDPEPDAECEEGDIDLALLDELNGIGGEAEGEAEAEAEQEEVDDEDDFLARAVSPVPMSLNQFASGVDFGDDDEYSSSDDSDDD